MKKCAAIFCVSLAFLLFRLNVFAWSAAGHQVIAAEAYRELSTDLKQKVTELLKAHPDYAKWEKAFNDDSAKLDLPTFIFMRASVWPDEIRRHGNQYDHPHWHYIDYPLKPPSFPRGPAPPPTNDALDGIEQCERCRADPNAPAQDRAVYLSGRVPLIGDLPQPL